MDLQAWLTALDPLALHAATFLLLFLEGGGIPGIPGVLPMLAQVPMIEAGHTTLAEAIFWGTLGNWLGSVAGYSVGRWGKRLIPAQWLSRLESEQAREAIARWGPLAIVASRTIGSLRTPVTFGAGALEYPFAAYIGLSLIGALIHIGVWQVILWRFGIEILPYIERAGGSIAAGLAAAAALYFLWRWWRGRAAA
ncbi:DedA family protein [Deinococcus lacus]|uniref:DedA family protein n=1 Tax=Deinococcus lacus TaxID=392561 RepID=A0ABW1YEP6_9DEIO